MVHGAQVYGAAELTQLRQPACEGCPLSGRKKTWGTGPLTAKVLIVSENAEDEGHFTEWAWGRIKGLLGLGRIDFESVRFESVIQCKEPVSSAKGSRAKAHCGPSLHQVIAGMPSLEAIFTFGEAALQEVSGYRAWEAESKAAATAVKYADRVLARALKGVGSKRYKGPSPEDAGAALAAAKARAEVPRRGWKGIADQRGSARRIEIRSLRPLGVEGSQTVWFFPSLHPKDTSPFKQPRLAPLLGIDFVKFCKLWRGEQTVPPLEYRTIRDAAGLGSYLHSLNGARKSVLLGAVPVALDIEYSRQARELVCVGIGPDALGRYAIIPFAERNGWRMPGPARRRMMAALQQAFNDPALAWGGHFACAYDRRKLQENGLSFRPKWDTLYGFHLCFADFGSPRDEEAEENGRVYTQSSGYDLGFVSSMLTVHPHHKGVVTHDIDALDVDTEALHTYCAQDVRVTFESWLALEHEFQTEWADPAKGIALMQLEMECANRVQAMSSRGVTVREAERQARLKEVLVALEALRISAVQISGVSEINLNSGPQLAKALEAQGVKVKRSTKTGMPQLDGNAIEALKRKYPENQFLDAILQLRSLQKDADAYEKMAPGEDGRVHPAFKVHGAVSRWSSSGPNFQNLTEEQKGLVG